MPPEIFDPTTWQIKDWVRIAWEDVHASSLVCPTPAFVFFLSIHSAGGGEADAEVFDGTSKNPDGKHIRLYTVDEDMRPLNWTPPLYFAKGIWVEVGTNVDSVVVQYLPWHG